MDVQWAIFWSNIFLGFVTLIAVYVALNKEDIKKPLVDIEFGNESYYTIYPYLKPMGMLFCIKIINEGKTMARNCKVKILSVKSEEGNNVLDKDEPDVLKWSGAPRDMGFRADPPDINLIQDINQLKPIFRKEKNISPKGGWELCDLFWVDCETRKILFSSTGGRNFICEDKRYFVTIEISGDNFEPVIKGIRIYTPCKMDWVSNQILFAGIEEIRPLFQ